MNDYDLYINRLEDDFRYRTITSNICQESFKHYLLSVFYIINGTKFKLKPFHKAQ